MKSFKAVFFCVSVFHSFATGPWVPMGNSELVSGRGLRLHKSQEFQMLLGTKGVGEGGSFHEVLFLALGSRASEGHAETRHP